MRTGLGRKSMTIFCRPFRHILDQRLSLLCTPKGTGLARQHANDQPRSFGRTNHQQTQAKSHNYVTSLDRCRTTHGCIAMQANCLNLKRFKKTYSIVCSVCAVCCTTSGVSSQKAKVWQHDWCLARHVAITQQARLQYILLFPPVAKVWHLPQLAIPN